jgi:hypothetical protein
MAELTQHQKIVTLMCRHRAQEWWLPHHFMTNNLGTLFVGYEAGARLAELGKRYPQAFESMPDGKYKKRRIRFESMRQWLHLLPTDLQDIIKKEAGVVAPAAPPPPPKPEPQKEAEPGVQQTLLDVPVPPRRTYF